jgi:hypothetical protein
MFTRRHVVLVDVEIDVRNPHAELVAHGVLERRRRPAALRAGTSLGAATMIVTIVRPLSLAIDTYPRSPWSTRAAASPAEADYASCRDNGVFLLSRASGAGSSGVLLRIASNLLSAKSVSERCLRA